MPRWKHEDIIAVGYFDNSTGEQIFCFECWDKKADGVSTFYEEGDFKGDEIVQCDECGKIIAE